MRKSLLPSAGENKFQKIKQKQLEAERNGVKLIKLSIGQPQGPAILQAREAAAKAVLQADESMHEYQDNGSPGVKDFAQRFVLQHTKTRFYDAVGGIDFLPIPGIKPMLGVVIDSMGGWKERCLTQVKMMTNPGYPTPYDQCLMRPWVDQHHLVTTPEEGFLFSVDSISSMIDGDLLMLNFPHNPTGIVATKEWLREICKYCSENGVRIFNDAAYSILTHTSKATTLTDVALDFPDLNWAEAFSASKAGNMTGWRIGAMVGSPEFISDIKRVKGNTDSGFNAALASGVIDLFERNRRQIEDVRLLYELRLSLLSQILHEEGMRLSVEPTAGFFALFECPARAFGQEITSADQFNDLMIERTGVVGVPFDPYIRYAICAADIQGLQTKIQEAFAQAKVSY